MKTLEEIKDEVAQEYGWKNWSSCYGEDGITNSIINEVSKHYAKEVAREALMNASSHFDEKTSLGQISINVITSESNIPEL